MLLLLAACGRSPGQPLDDDEKIVRAVLATLASDGKPVCVDGKTSGRALTTYREFLVAPPPSRAGLVWHPPIAFRPPVMPTQSAIDKAEAQGKDITLPEPADRHDAVLPQFDQANLDAAAHALSLPPVPDRSIAIDGSWAPHGVSAGWWPINRMKGDCTPIYMVSNPARNSRIAFVEVKAAHWGTIYALRPKGADWAPVGQWTSWLY